MQKDGPATSGFLLCLAYWLSKAQRKDVCCRLTVHDKPNDPDNLHWRRSLFLLQEYREMLGTRFEVVCEQCWKWPEIPWMNQARNPREANAREGKCGEHELEVQIATSSELLEEFRRVAGDVVRFDRQLPVGLFNGCVSETTRWTPGQASQVDLWAESADTKTVHLLELKKPGNLPLGAIQELVYYGRMLHYVRRGLPDVGRISGSGPGLESIRRSERLIVWLVAHTVHPLLYSKGDSPLAWLNDATRDQGLEFRILPYEQGTDNRISRWRVDCGWPKHAPAY